MEPSNFETEHSVKVVDDNDGVREILTTLTKKTDREREDPSNPNRL